MSTLETTITWDPKERAAIDGLMTSQQLSERAVIRQALRHYQLHCLRIHAGESCTYSGDHKRAAEFAGAGWPDGGHSG